MATVITCYYRPKPGGFCKRLFRAIDALLAAGHVVHYLAVVPFPISHPRCRFHRFPWPQRRTDSLIFWFAFALLAPPLLLIIGIRHRVDRCFAFGPPYALFMQPLRVINRAPLRLFLRADTVLNHTLKSRTIFARLELIAEGFALKGADIYGVSRALTAAVIQRHRILKPRSAHTFPNDIPSLPAAPREEFCQPLTLITLGVLEERKNHGVLLDCLAVFPPHEVQLQIWGDGPARAELERKAQVLGITDRIQFKGWCHEPARIWATCDGLLFPSIHEGAPNAVLEALAHNIPVLLSDIPEHREILGDNGIVPNNATSWYQAIQNHLLHAKSRNALGEAQQLASLHLRFDWDREIANIIANPNKVVGTTDPGRIT